MPGATTVHPKGRDTRQQRVIIKQLHNRGTQAARSVQLTCLQLQAFYGCTESVPSNKAAYMECNTNV